MAETGRNQCLIWLFLYVTLIIFKKHEKHSHLGSQKKPDKAIFKQQKNPNQPPTKKNPQNKPHQAQP